MKFIKMFRLNEFHPGARSIQETIEFYILSGEDQGISREASLEAIRKILAYFDGGEPEKVKRGTLEANALENMGQCILTAEDDGYPLKWVIEALREFS
jgi:hypothetical protein